MYLSALFLALVALAVVVPVHQAVADEPHGVQVGDVLKLESVKGTAHGAGQNERMKATLSLTLTVTSVNKTRVRFAVTSGQISFGDNTYTVTSGEGGAVLAKFGWITLHGNTTLSTGKMFGFRLEGMIHRERPGLSLAGLAGGIGDESSRSRLRFAAKLSRS